MEINLESIHGPEDLRKFSPEELTALSDDIRKVLIKKLAAHGGHVGPNLGVVEATVALHYVFDTPKDKIVFDVSHQTYIHKMLTGRMQAFTDPVHYDDVTGYTSPSESPEYDLFEVGHTSTSISLATGLAKARDIEKGDWNVVAFIGDASLGGGMALEGLNYAPELDSNFIVVLNDNQRSIAENHGALYRHLEELRDSNGQCSNNIFKALGYEYIYVAEGNNVKALIKAFEQAKDKQHAVLVHINTMKGEGLPVAEANKEHFHYAAPFDLKTGADLVADVSEDYIDIFASHLLEKISADPKLVAITAGTPGVFGFDEDMRKQAGKQFVDVGIAEQDAVTMAAGLAKGGAHPVMGVVSTFFQRAYDQLSHDVGINNLPATFVVFYGSVFGMNDVTHLGFFDIAMVGNIPNIRYLAPASAEEYLLMIDQTAGNPKAPTVIRTPGGRVVHADLKIDTDFDKYQTVREGKDFAVIAEGPMLQIALEAAELCAQQGMDVKVVNPRILSQVDEAALDGLKDFKHVVTIEDGIVDGGFGQKVSGYLARYGTRVTNLGLRKEFIDKYSPKKLLEANGMTAEQVAGLFH